jgi:Ca-activated chloride channel family protein
VQGRDTAKALATVEAALAAEETPGTILLMTDGVEPGGVDAIKAYRGRDEIMVLAFGTAAGGPVKTGPDTFLTAGTGQRVIARLDLDALHKLKQDTDAQVATVTSDDSDTQWIARRAQSHLEQKQAESEARWNDVGWWLTIPIALMGALWFRRGWTIRWASVLLLFAVVSSPGGARADGWRVADMWLTPDQQGRLAFERGDYAAAAEHFADPMWRGVALYRAGRYDDAIDAFARLDTAESWFDQGNALAKLGKLEPAAAAYGEALRRKPDFAAAKANLELVQRLIPKKPPDDDQQPQEPSEKADQIQFDDKAKKGARGQVDVARQTAEMWMRNIQTSPAQLLRRKFAIEAGEPHP